MRINVFKFLLQKLNMRSEILAVVFGVALIVLVSGCVQTPGFGGKGATGGEGIVVNVFQPTLASIRSGEDIAFHIEVQNTGGYDNAPVVAELTGINAQDWQVYNKFLDLGRIAAPDPETGTSGGTSTGDWVGKAPMLRKGQVMTYNPIARVYYYYETYATKPVWFVTSDELRRIVQTGSSLESKPTENTKAPVKVEIKTGNFIRSSNWQNAKFNVEFKIINDGNGLIAGKDYPVYVEVSYPDGITPVGQCPPTRITATGIYENIPSGVSYPTFGTPVRLWNGKETSFTCEFQITNPPTNRELREFRVKLGYVYYTDIETSIQVTGTEEGFICCLLYTSPSPRD